MNALFANVLTTKIFVKLSSASYKMIQYNTRLTYSQELLSVTFTVHAYINFLYWNSYPFSTESDVYLWQSFVQYQLPVCLPSLNQHSTLSGVVK